MTDVTEKARSILLCSLVAAAVLTGTARPSLADDDREFDESTVIRGIAVTGANNRLGEPLWYLGDGLGTASFAFVFGHNTEGEEPLALTPASSEDTVLATGLDANFLAALGLSADSIDSRFVNVPFRQVPVIVDPFAGTRETVPSALTAEPFQVSAAVPRDPITLGDWLKAKGLARVRCHGDGTATVTMWLRGLVENGVYTVWALFGLDTDGNGLEDAMVPTPFGGVPNVVVPGRRGSAKFVRTLGYCPKEEPGLKFVDVTYHSDTNVYGGTVDLFLDGFPGFAVTNTHVAFPFNVQPLQ